MYLSKKVTHLKAYDKTIDSGLKNASEFKIAFTKFEKDNKIQYICGKFKKAYISENESSIGGSYKRYGLHLDACGDGSCMFCDNRNPAYGGYYAHCKLYNKEIYKADVFESSNHDYACCCPECIEDNSIEDDFEESCQIYPYYVQHLKNSIYKDKVEEISWRDPNFIDFSIIEHNTEILEKEMKTILTEIFKSESEVNNKLKEYENKNVHYISEFIDMFHLSNGDFIVNRITPKFVDTAVLINKEIDEFIENYLNKLNQKG